MDWTWSFIVLVFIFFVTLSNIYSFLLMTFILIKTLKFSWGMTKSISFVFLIFINKKTIVEEKLDFQYYSQFSRILTKNQNLIYYFKFFLFREIVYNNNIKEYFYSWTTNWAVKYVNDDFCSFFTNKYSFMGLYDILHKFAF